jgi:hypothetical protein
MVITNKQIEFLCNAYKECLDEEERIETIEEFAQFYEVPQYQIRQTLQNKGVFVKKEGKTEKEQYANALYAITLIPQKEWMKLTLKSKKALMEVFKGSNKNG